MKKKINHIIDVIVLVCGDPIVFGCICWTTAMATVGFIQAIVYQCHIPL